MTAIQRAEGKAEESEGKRDKKRRRRGAGEDGIVQQSREGKGGWRGRKRGKRKNGRRQIEAQEGKKGEKARVVRYS